MKDKKINKIDDFLLRMVEAKQIPGAVYSVIDEKKTIVRNAVGISHLEKNIPMKLDTIFDLASLTKVCATLPSILLLFERGIIDFDDPIQNYFSETVNRDVTIRHLLTHTSGYMASFPFYKYGMTKEQILHFIITQQTIPGKNVIYSDLNFILLGMLVEKLTGQTLDQFTEQNIYRPLGMVNTGFNPQVNCVSIAPTEWIKSQNRYQWGEVHDENASYMHGVSGHAGLFSNIYDLEMFVRMFLNNGLIPSGSYFLSPATIAASLRNYTQNLNMNRGLGWQLVDDNMSPAGYILSRNSFGHTGFTGTSIWIDPERRLGFILLSNRVHISRKINMNRIRRIFHNLAVINNL